MKAIKDVLAGNPDKRALINAVINHISITNVLPVIEMGPNAGFSGFIYPHDTIKFYKRHRKAINEWVNEIANIKGLKPTMYVCTLMAKNGGVNEAEKNEIELCLSGGELLDDKHMPALDFLALWALEQVCRLFLSE